MITPKQFFVNFCLARASPSCGIGPCSIGQPPILPRVGLSSRYRTARTNDSVSVTRVIFWLDLLGHQLPYMAFSKYQGMITPRQFFVKLCPARASPLCGIGPRYIGRPPILPRAGLSSRYRTACTNDLVLVTGAIFWFRPFTGSPASLYGICKIPGTDNPTQHFSNSARPGLPLRVGSGLTQSDDP